MPHLCIIVPTFINEVHHGAEVSARVANAFALRCIDWELIFVDDDFPDDTGQTVRELARTEPRAMPAPHWPTYIGVMTVSG